MGKLYAWHIETSQDGETDLLSLKRETHETISISGNTGKGGGKKEKQKKMLDTAEATILQTGKIGHRVDCQHWRFY